MRIYLCLCQTQVQTVKQRKSFAKKGKESSQRLQLWSEATKFPNSVSMMSALRLISATTRLRLVNPSSVANRPPSRVSRPPSVMSTTSLLFAACALLAVAHATDYYVDLWTSSTDCSGTIYASSLIRADQSNELCYQSNAGSIYGLSNAGTYHRLRTSGGPTLYELCYYGTSTTCSSDVLCGSGLADACVALGTSSYKVHASASSFTTSATNKYDCSYPFEDCEEECEGCTAAASGCTRCTQGSGTCLDSSFTYGTCW